MTPATRSGEDGPELGGGAAPARTFPIDLRPLDDRPVHTAELPPTPTRERTIPATAWVEAPDELLALGAGIGDPVASFIRRIGPWLLWRAGPPRDGHSRYLAVAADVPARTWRFDLHPDGEGRGDGPDGAVHTRFRTWKEALRDHPEGAR